MTTPHLPARRFPTRTCVACRTSRQKRDFVRIVRSPGGEIRFDPSGRAAGRGAYLCSDGACWATAVKRNSIQHALKGTLPVDVRDRLERTDLTLSEGGVIGAQ
ncbi:MAG: YlxR family protein [Chloroflexi bacterium]|nr:YlxR family protein [Chloroflexota bacterium]